MFKYMMCPAYDYEPWNHNHFEAEIKTLTDC